MYGLIYLVVEWNETCANNVTKSRNFIGKYDRMIFDKCEIVQTVELKIMNAALSLLQRVFVDFMVSYVELMTPKFSGGKM